MLIWNLDHNPQIYSFLSVLPLWGCEAQRMPDYNLPAECGVEPAAVPLALRILPVLFHSLGHVGDPKTSLYGIGCGANVL